MIVPGHAKSRHRYRGTLSTIERRILTSQAETKKGHARDASKDQRGSEVAIRYGIFESIQVSPMGG